MTADEIAQHPLVVRMMRRLEALEGRGNIIQGEGKDVHMEKSDSEENLDDNNKSGTSNTPQEVEVCFNIAHDFENSCSNVMEKPMHLKI